MSRPARRRSAAPLEPVIAAALREDIGRGDWTTRRVVGKGIRGRAEIRAKERMVIAGLPVAAAVFRTVDPRLRFRSRVREGSPVGPGTVVARIEGSARSILLAERTALNFLQHLSGIATYTAECVRRAAGRCAIRDTRKTAPGLRRLAKYAVRVGGGMNHRMALDDGILIKSNHWRLAGGVGAAVLRARRSRRAGPALPVQVEVSTLADLRAALAAGADAVLLDNLPPSRLRRTLAVARGKVFVELSGGITRENLRRYARLRPDAISLGALTHRARWVDLSLRLEETR